MFFKFRRKTIRFSSNTDFLNILFVLLELTVLRVQQDYKPRPFSIKPRGESIVVANDNILETSAYTNKII